MSEIEKEVEFSEDIPPYTLVFNDLIGDDDLRLQTRAVLILMLSRPKDWDFSIRGMAKIAKVSKDTMAKMISELEQAGYVRRKYQTRKGGRFGKAGFIVSARPIFKGKSSPCPNFSDANPSYTKNSPQQNKEQQNKELYPNPCGQEIFEEAVNAVADVGADGDVYAVQEAVIQKLYDCGFVCTRGVSVDARDPNTSYGGRLGLLATKSGTTIGFQIDRKSPRDKSVFKLREYPCDFRVIVLREGVQQPAPEGIDAVIALKGFSETETMFERFWKAYPRRQGKEDARKAWKKLSPDLALCKVMSAALAEQKKSKDWTKDGGQYIPYPATWLNGKRWQDELEAAAPDPGAPEIPEGDERRGRYL